MSSNKYRHILLLVLLLGWVVSTCARPFTLVIDPGHGGHDAGAVGTLVQEKFLNLDVSLRLEKLIQEAYPDVQGKLTRRTDVFLTLQERADFVNKQGADLFISVHTNSAESHSAHGAEVWVLGQDDKRMAGNLDVAMRENAVMLLESDYKATYQGFDPNSVDSYIMFELMQNQYVDQSLRFATLVQDGFVRDLHRTDRGVRQAGFWVLYKSACPSVLVEMGFISHREEERFLASADGRQQVANAIFNAFVQYKAAYDRKNGIQPKEVTLATTNTVKDAPAEQKTDKTEETVLSVAHRPEFRVQIFSALKEVPKGDYTFRGLKGCRYTRDGKYYKYTYGNETDYHAIQQLQSELKAKFPDCFIVAFVDGKQIPLKEALKLND